MTKIENATFGLAVFLVTLAVTMLIALGSASSADARDGFGRMGMGMGMGRGGGPGRLMEQFDANADGAITQQEIEQTQTQDFQQFDSNQDGALSLDEFEPLWLEQSRPRMVDRFQSFDGDGSGSITAEEFEAPTENLVTRLDENDDGKVTADEMGPKGRGMFGRGRR